ncbi:hypothetical protein AVEN_129248-1 [Araneus ventricosus]|uniref:Uncharacterized protein n=1 Tax=Araneus ventricosus TaxID=182803 RepID=A0A4Y2RBR1_ARAVE|nr:hypothetical protein AVEN_129248-1 [Araneus ventricosus]
MGNFHVVTQSKTWFQFPPFAWLSDMKLFSDHSTHCLFTRPLGGGPRRRSTKLKKTVRTGPVPYCASSPSKCLFRYLPEQEVSQPSESVPLGVREAILQ